MLAIQKFLEAAAQHEMCGKVRLRRFIEGLLRRIALAERLLEYYQNTPHEHYCTAHMVQYVKGHTVRLGAHLMSFSVSYMCQSDLSIVRHAIPTLRTLLFVQVAPLAETGPQRITKSRYGLDSFRLMLSL